MAFAPSFPLFSVPSSSISNLSISAGGVRPRVQHLPPVHINDRGHTESPPDRKRSWINELFPPLADGEDGARGHADHLFRRASEDHVFHSRAAVRPDHDEVRRDFPSLSDDFPVWYSRGKHRVKILETGKVAREERVHGFPGELLHPAAEH